MRAVVLESGCELALGCFCSRAVRADARLCACATVRVERKRRLREVIKGWLENERKEGASGNERERERVGAQRRDSCGCRTRTARLEATREESDRA